MPSLSFTLHRHAAILSHRVTAPILAIGRAINCFKQEACARPSEGERCMRLLLITRSHLQPAPLHVKLHRHKKYVCAQTAPTFPSVLQCPACPDHTALPSTGEDHSFSTKASFLAISTSKTGLKQPLQEWTVSAISRRHFSHDSFNAACWELSCKQHTAWLHVDASLVQATSPDLASLPVSAN